MLKVLDEGLIVEIGPVVDLDLLVEGLELLLDLVLGGGDQELLLGGADVGGVHQEQDLSLDAAVVGRVLDLEDGVSISTRLSEPRIPQRK